MINVLERKLQEAQQERDNAIKPYEERIRNLKQAIENLQKFNQLSELINDWNEDVCAIPSMNEAAVIHEMDK